jgi:hypothetical protein
MEISLLICVIGGPSLSPLLACATYLPSVASGHRNHGQRYIERGEQASINSNFDFHEKRWMMDDGFNAKTNFRETNIYCF